jgi:hypothetical protein
MSHVYVLERLQNSILTLDVRERIGTRESRSIAHLVISVVAGWRGTTDASATTGKASVLEDRKRSS